MSQLAPYLKSGIQGLEKGKPLERIVIGLPGYPTQLLIYQGKIYIYNPSGQTLIDGGYITAQAIAAQAITTEKLAIGSKKFVHNLVWTPIDKNTCAWSAGNITFADGSQVSINSGNTGLLTNKTYIYYNGSSILRKTETYSIAIGGSNIPLAIIEPVDDGNCIITPFVSTGATINGSLIVTGKIQSIDGKTYFDLNEGVLVVDDGFLKRVRIGADGEEYVAKVSLDGYDVDVETDIDKFALWVSTSDTNDNVLIKEKTRGSITVDAEDNEVIPHGLDYVPFILCFYLSDTGVYRKMHGQNDPTSPDCPFASIDNTNLTIYNPLGSEQTIKYYIFYDLVA